MVNGVPRGFQPAGRVLWAHLAVCPPGFFPPRRRKGAKAEGVRYERKVQRKLDEMYEGYLPSPWIRFRSEGDTRSRWCQPDGLIVDIERGIIIVLEIKLKHTEYAWWQLRRLYIPVVQRLFDPDDRGLWRFSACEIVRWYDAHMAFPEALNLRPDPARAKPDEFSVHIMRP